MSLSNGDTRKDYILATIANYFNIPTQNEEIANLVKSEKLNNFLDDGNALILSANVEELKEGGKKIHLDNATHVSNADKKVQNPLANRTNFYHLLFRFWYFSKLDLTLSLQKLCTEMSWSHLCLTHQSPLFTTLCKRCTPRFCSRMLNGAMNLTQNFR